jgi:hypothetical protein
MEFQTMRNILIFPITDEEIIDELKKIILTEKCESVGGIKLICLQLAIERVLKNPNPQG